MYRTLSLFVIIVRAAASETISYADRAYLVSHLQITCEFVRDTTRGLTNEQWVYQPRPGSWSIAQCIDHLARTEEYVLRLVRGAFAHVRRALAWSISVDSEGQKGGDRAASANVNGGGRFYPPMDDRPNANSSRTR